MSSGVGGRRGWDPALLWLLRSLVTTALIRPLAWEPPYAAGAAQEIPKRQKKKKEQIKKKKEIFPFSFLVLCIWFLSQILLRILS